MGCKCGTCDIFKEEQQGVFMVDTIAGAPMKYDTFSQGVDPNLAARAI